MASYVSTFTGNGSEVHFTAGFPVLRLTDLAVVVNSVWLTLGVDYSVSGSTSGPLATLAAAPANGATVTLRSAVGYTPTDPAAPYAVVPTLNSTDEAIYRWASDEIAKARGANPYESTSDASTVLATGTSVSRTLADRAADVFRPADYATLQACVDAAAAVGGEVLLDAETYTITSALSVPQGVTIRGQGSGSIIHASGCDGIHLVEGSYLTRGGLYSFVLRGDQDVGGYTGIEYVPVADRIQGYTIDGLNLDWFERGIDAEEFRWVQITNCTFRCWVGINFHRRVNKVFISNCNMAANELAAADFTGNSYGVKMDDSGVGSGRPEDVQISDCLTYGYDYGVYVASGLHVIVRNCDLDFCYIRGFQASTADGGFVVRDNWIMVDADDGIGIEFANRASGSDFQKLIVGNYIGVSTHATEKGIRLGWNQQAAVVRDNYILIAGDGIGIEADNTSGTVVDGNTVPWGPAWASDTTFASGATCYYGTHAYTSLQAANQNHNPASSPTWWSDEGEAKSVFFNNGATGQVGKNNLFRPPTGYLVPAVVASPLAVSASYTSATVSIDASSCDVMNVISVAADDYTINLPTNSEVGKVITIVFYNGISGNTAMNQPTWGSGYNLAGGTNVTMPSNGYQRAISFMRSDLGTADTWMELWRSSADIAHAGP